MSITCPTNKKTALILGINGQDASYLAELLLLKNYNVYGTIRKNSVPESQTSRINLIYNQLIIHYMDLTDPISVGSVISLVKPDELYHLAAQSDVRVSFDLPKYTLDVNGGGTLNVLESVYRFSPQTKVYHAGTSEMFGNSIDTDGFQRETTSMQPVSPYGCAKLYAHNLCDYYRKTFNMFVCSGILFNHESPRRGLNFVSNKIINEAVKIKVGLSNKLYLGNLEAHRDWGHAKDFVYAMWSMLQQEKPKDFVVATGQTRSVQDFINIVFSKLDLDFDKYVFIDENLKRPQELNFLKGDASLAIKELGWQKKYTFDSMVEEMLEHWLNSYVK